MNLSLQELHDTIVELRKKLRSVDAKITLYASKNRPIKNLTIKKKKYQKDLEKFLKLLLEFEHEVYAQTECLKAEITEYMGMPIFDYTVPLDMIEYIKLMQHEYVIWAKNTESST